MHKEQTAGWVIGSLQYIQALVCTIEMIYAVFICLGMLLQMPASWQGILLVLVSYLALNLMISRYGAAPSLAEFLAKLGLCSMLTVFDANYSAILYHLLLIRMTLRSDRERATRVAVLISTVFLLSAVFHTGNLDSRYVFNVLFNLLGLGILAFAAMYVRSLVVKQVSTDVKVKELIKQNDYHHHMAITDRLTGLYNYRGYTEKVNEFSQCVLLIIDIDYFKKLNDTYGHLYGDKVLAGLGQLIKSSLRKGDLAFRYGGEEFVLVLPQTSSQLGYTIAQELREKVAQNRFCCGKQPVPVTISVGMAVKNQELDARAVFENADCALYRAKNCGRNNVQLYDELVDVKTGSGV